MNVDNSLPPDEQFATVLAAWDEALAAGATPGPATDGSPELLGRLERGLACLQRLQRLRPHAGSAADTPQFESSITSELHQSSSADAAESFTHTSEAGRRYTLTRLHATGGIGRVWLAFDRDLGREVALKELRPERSQDRGFADRFVHEAQITGQLEHPGIVPVYELAHRSEDGQPFYTMRFIKGRTLSDAIRAYHEKRTAGRAEPLERVALLNAFVATCNALAYAHSRGVIHRDLKGQNVVLGDFGEVVVLDWGFAKVLNRADDSADSAPVVLAAEAGPGHTIEGQVIGTPAYMAPEQAAGQTNRIDHHTDVYGLGAILYELLTGRPPFAGAGAEDVLRQVREVEPARPRQISAGVPRTLEAVCLRALAKEPTKRYASAGELAREVQRWLADEPVMAYREPTTARLARWARRHQTLSAGLAVLFVSAVIGAVIFHQLRARHELRVQTAEKLAEADRKALVVVETAAYLKYIALAQEAASAKQLSRADELLERCEPALRNWDWHYLQRRTHRNLHTLRGHPQGTTQNQNLRSVVYRPDGEELASAGVDGSIRIWNAKTGQWTKTLRGHAGGVFRLSYRPSDGRYLASTGVTDGKVRVWDISTEKMLFECSHDHRAVLGVAYTPDGRQFASSSWDKSVKIWNADDGRLVKTLVQHTHRLGVIAFRPPDGRQLAVASLDNNTVTLRDATTGKELHSFPGATGINNLLAFSPNGERLAVCGGENKIVTVWDATDLTEKGKEIWALPGRGDTLPVVAFSPNGRYLAVASADQAVRIMDAATGRVVRTLRGHRAMLGSVAFSPDSRQLATAGNDAIIKLWDVTDVETNVGPEYLLLGSHPQGGRSLAISPDNMYLASAGADGAVRIWDAKTGGAPYSLMALGASPIAPAALAHVLAATTASEVRIFHGHRGAVFGVVFSPDGTRLASAGEDGAVVVRDSTTGGEIVTIRVRAGSVRSVVFSADGQRFATASGERTIAVWDAASGRELRSFQGDGDAFHSVAFRPDGRWLAAADAVGTLQVWDTATGEVICIRRAQPGNTAKRLVEKLLAVSPSSAQPRAASCVAFSSNGKRLAWTSEDLTVAICDLSDVASRSLADTAVEPIRCLGHTGWVTSLAFSPDGTRLISADEGGVVKLWDTKTGQEALTLPGHSGAVRGVAFSPDGRLVAAIGNDGTITIWDGTPLDRDPRR